MNNALRAILPKLHQRLQNDLPEPMGVIDCWREMFAIAKEKDLRPQNEYVAYKGVTEPAQREMA